MFDEFKNIHKGRCKCIEKSKHISQRELVVYAYYPTKVWGRAYKRYDGRKLLEVRCRECGATWKDYDPNSPLWELIQDNPYSGEEKIVVLPKTEISIRLTPEQMEQISKTGTLDIVMSGAVPNDVKIKRSKI